MFVFVCVRVSSFVFVRVRVFVRCVRLVVLVARGVVRVIRG